MRFPALMTLLATCALQAQEAPLWTLGSPDRDTREFALAPASWRSFEGDGAVVIGQSAPARDWPYVHPGPDEGWAGNRPHPFRILFGLAASPAAGDAELAVEALDAREWGEMELELRVNGRIAGRETVARGTPGAGPVDGDFAKTRPQTLRFRFPATLLSAGANEAVLTVRRGGWFLYDSVSLRAAGARLAQPPPDTLLLEAAAVRGLVERDGRSFQPIRLRLLRVGPAAEQPLRVDGLEVARTSLRPGLQEVELLVPAVDRPQAVEVAVGSGRREVALKPVPRLTVYVVPHSHTDIGYTHLQSEIEAKQVENLAKGMALAERTAGYPEGARFVWNVEVLWAADLFLQRRDGAQQAAFQAAVQAGRVALNGLYLNTLTGLCRPEEMVQNLRFATRLGGRLGVPIDTAMISDVPGHSWGLVPAMAQAGIRYFSTSPNFFDRIGTAQMASADQPFWWVGPDGRDRVLTWNSYQGYALSSGWQARLTPARVGEYLDHLEEIHYPYDLTYIRWSGLGDNAEPDPGICESVKDWNAKFAWPRFAISDQRRPFAELEKRHGDKIPVRYGDWTPYWEDGAGSSARETALNRQSADRMTQAQALFALRAPERWPATLADEAWKKVLLYSEHTWGAHNSISEPELDFVKAQWATKRGYAEEASALSKRLLAEAEAGEAAPGAFDVVNTLSWARTGVVRVRAELSRGGDRALGMDGRAVPSQRLASGELAVLVEDLPPFTARRYRVVPGRPEPPRRGAASVLGQELSNGFLDARIDGETGDVADLRAAGMEGGFVDAGGALNRYLLMAGRDARHLRTSGPARVTAVEKGPLVATLRAESPAPGTRGLVRDATLEACADRLDLVTRVDKLRAPAPPDGDYHAEASKESVNLAFPLAVQGGQLRLELPLGGVMRPDLEQIPGSCKNWFCVGNWADVSAPGRGLTWVSLDAPLLQVGGLTARLLNSQTDPRAWQASTAPSSGLYAWLMNNHWGTNYRAYQEGPAAFRFALRPHLDFDSAAATRLATGLAQPLLAIPAAGEAPSGRPRLSLSTEDVVVTAFKPSDDGRGWILRLQNVSGRDARVSLTWSQPAPTALFASDTSERRGALLEGPVALPAWGFAALRAER